MSPPRPSSKQLIAALRLDGLEPGRRAKGSHQAFQKKVDDSQTITVIVVIGKKEIPPGTMRSILKQWGITEGRLRELLTQVKSTSKARPK